MGEIIFRNVLVKVKCSRYRWGVAQRVGRDIALLFHDRGTRRGWVVSSTPRPHFALGKDPVPIVQEAGWAVWTGGKSRPHRDSIPDRPAHSQSLYRQSYLVHRNMLSWLKLWINYYCCIYLAVYIIVLVTQVTQTSNIKSYSVACKIDTAGCPETQVPFYKTAQCHNPHDSILL